jgi:hypothetical protein
MKKREELLKSKKDVDVEFVVEQDKAFLEKQISDREYELGQTNRSIRTFLINPDLVINNEFITLVGHKKSLEKQIDNYKAIIEEYL